LQAKKEADAAEADGARIQSELAAEKKTRGEFDEQVSTIKEEVSEAEASEQVARAALDTATAKRAELECQASSAHSDLESARSLARQSQQRLTASKQLVERLHEAGKGLSAELKRRAEIWEKSLADGNFDGLEEALASGVPTFAQVTCQVASPSAKSQHDEGRDDADMTELEKQKDVTAAHPTHPKPKHLEMDGAAEPCEHKPSDDDQRQSAAPAAASSGGLPPAASVSILAASAPAEPNPGGAMAVEEVASDDDELLAAATREPAGGERPAAAIGGSSAGALPGCSTAWSLEMLDAPAPSGDFLQPAKRIKLNGD